MATVEELQKKVRDLEAKLAAAQGLTGPGRQKIEVMSSEVVDSNPYRYFTWISLKLNKIELSSFEQLFIHVLQIVFSH